MRTRFLTTMVVATAVAVPAVALGDIPPHSNYYDQHPPENGKKNDVSVVINRATHTSSVYVYNFCLGANVFGGIRYPQQAHVNPGRVRNGKLSFRGKAVENNVSGVRKIPVTLSATVQATKVTGKFTFPGTSCGTIRFTAKLQKRTA